MSVYIKGMEMPTRCWECHFGHGDSGLCVVDFKQHGDWNAPQNCPLVPVPPHGRLIDADALLNDLLFPSKQFEQGMRELIGGAPTIIPAEEEE